MESKAAYVHQMFSSIADRYDLLNTLLSFNQDKYWRRFAASCALTPTKSGDLVGTSGFQPNRRFGWVGNSGIALDVAAGTGEVALELLRESRGEGKVVGVDFCERMLCKAKSKVANADIELVLAEAERLPFSDSTFDCAITGFALRNVADVEKTLHEMARVVKVKGKVVCLEITQPPKGLFRKIYRFYLSILLPFLGGLISRNRDAYAYLPQSIIEFYSPEKLRQIMEEAGLKDIQIHPLTLGIASVWVGTKGGR